MKNLSNEEVQHLLNQIAQKNDKAFNALYECLSGYVLKAVSFKYPDMDKEKVCTAVDDAFLELIKTRIVINDFNHLKNTLKMIATNKLTDIYRAEKNVIEKEVNFGDLVNDEDDVVDATNFIDVIADFDFSPLEKLMKQELNEALYECIKKLKSFNLREIAWLTIEDFTYEEIATSCEKKIGTIKSSSFQIRDLLGTCMGRAYGMEKK